MSTIPYYHHDQHPVGNFLRAGQATPRSTSPRTSQVDLPLSSNPDQYPGDAPEPGTLTRQPSRNGSIRTGADDTHVPTDNTADPEGGLDTVTIAPADVEKLKYHRFEY